MKNNIIKYQLPLFLMMHLIITSTYNLGHPVTPQYIEDIKAKAYMTGVLLSMMALAQFTFAPLWGQISDNIGRKIVFLGPIGYGIGQLGFFFVHDANYLLFFRFISGAFAVATNAIHYAYISDISSVKKRSTNLGIAAAIIPIGSFFGFAFGGQIGQLVGPRNTFLIQAIISMVNGLILYLIMNPNTKFKRNFNKIKWNVYAQNIRVLKKYQDSNLKYILILTFINVLAYTFIVSQGNVILKYGFNKDVLYIGNFIAFLNLSAGLIGFALQKIIFKRIDKEYIYLPYLSLACCITSFIAFSSSFTSPLVMWIGLMITTVLNTIFVAIIQLLIASLDKDNDRGTLVGLNHSFSSLASFAGSLITGFVLNVWTFLPFIVGGIIYFIVFLYSKFSLVRKLN